MTRKRRKFSPEQKVAILRQHLLEKKSVSGVCENEDISVNLFYQWQQAFFENGSAAFEKNTKNRKSQKNAQDKKIDQLQQKLQKKNEVLAEVMEEHVRLKKELGEL